MKSTITIIDGQGIQHKDVIHHSTSGVFGWWERFKIFLGKEVQFEVAIYTMNDEALVVKSVPYVRVAPLFKRKQQGEGEIAIHAPEAQQSKPTNHV